MNNPIANIKEEIVDGIERERTEANKKHDKNKESITKIDNVPELLKMLVNVCENNIEQGDMMVRVLKVYLQSDFFKNTKPSIKANEICYENESFAVLFPKTSTNTITIYNKKKVRKPTALSPSPVRVNIVRFNEMWNKYELTEKGYRDLVNLYSEITRSMSAGPIFRMKIKLSNELYEFAEDVKNHLKKIEFKEISFKIKSNEYINSNKLLDEFIEDIKEDLYEFRKEGWFIKVSNSNEGYISTHDI